MRLTKTERLELAANLMLRFARRTGVTSNQPSRRYLWTDAFAVCNFLGLARLTGRREYTDIALRLVDSVHRVLGRYRQDDSRVGWISGLSEEQALLHPTRGGLRIGKKLSERKPNEPFDERLEWDRDGQYFHYLTKWMVALDQTARRTKDARFNLWARELAQTACAAFVYESPVRGDRSRMYWKMSTDLSRPLVPSMGQHDPIDGFITAIQLRNTLSALPGAGLEPDLANEAARLAGMIDIHALATADPLGLGGLLSDGFRVSELGFRDDDRLEALLDALLTASHLGLRHYAAHADLRAPSEQRLGFREIGLAIGLGAVSLMSERRTKSATLGSLRARVGELERYAALRTAIESFWLDPANQSGRSWTDHLDINEVMLATSLAPEGFLVLEAPDPGSSETSI